VGVAAAAWQRRSGGGSWAVGAALTAAALLRSGCGSLVAPAAANQRWCYAGDDDNNNYNNYDNFEDRGTTVQMALLSATAAPVATSTMAAAAQTRPKATLMISFVNLNTLLN
jgi:hypothetical protein